MAILSLSSSPQTASPDRRSGLLRLFVLAVVLLFAAGSAQGQTVAQLRASLATSGAGQGSELGAAVAVDGSTAVVGAAGQDKAYIFEYSGTAWQMVQVVSRSNEGERFGASVAVDGDYLLVGAPKAAGFGSGAVYIYEKSGGSWPATETKILQGIEPFVRFGASVAVDGSRAIIGAPNRDEGSKIDVGRAYVVERSGGSWPSTDKAVPLEASNPEERDHFGASADIDDDRIIVGAPEEDGPSGNKNNTGAAYIFERSNGSWPSTESDLLRPTDSQSGGDRFGSAVAIDGNHALVGAPREDGAAESQSNAGAILAYERQNAGWPASTEQVLRASDASSGAKLGTSVALDGQRAVAGTVSEKAYLFERSGTSWPRSERARLQAPGSGSNAEFGKAVSLDDRISVVGAPSTDVAGDTDEGTAYVRPLTVTPKVVDDPENTSVSGTPLRVDVLSNDAPNLASIDPSSVRIERSPLLGTTRIDSSGVITYTTGPDVSGRDSLTYTVANEAGGRSVEATVRLRVLPDAIGSGHALDLDGIGDYVALPNDPSINTNGPYDHRTIELWFRAEGTGTKQVLYEEGGTGIGLNVYLNNGRLYAGGYSDGTWSTWLSTSAVQRDTWHHVALVFEEANDYAEKSVVRAYLNGQEFGRAEVGNPVGQAGVARLSSHGDPVAIGAVRSAAKLKSGDVTTTGKYFQGRIDQVRLWNGALSQTEIRAWSRRTIAPTAPAADSLIAAYRFDVGSDTTAHDYATADSSPESGSLAGDPQWTDFSGAALGDTSAVVVLEGDTSRTFGPSGSAVRLGSSAQNTSGDTLQVYRSGRPTAPLVDSSQAGEDFSAVAADRRLPVVWGLGTFGPDTLTTSVSVTLTFSGIRGVRDSSSVRLLRRTGPGAPWTDVTSSWTLTDEETFVNSRIVPGQYAVAGDRQSLPVELVAFEGTRTDSGVRLSWRTVSERGNAAFQVQRRTEARGETDRRWTTVGRRAGAGTTEQPQTYRFTDADLPGGADTLAYRLRQIDTDGTAHVSETITVALSTVREADLRGTYPNPARRQATVEFAVPEGATDARLTLHDVLGRTVRTIDASPGRHERTLDVSDLASGVYVLQLRAGETSEIRKLTIVK